MHSARFHCMHYHNDETHVCGAHGLEDLGWHPPSMCRAKRSSWHTCLSNSWTVRNVKNKLAGLVVAIVVCKLHNVRATAFKHFFPRQRRNTTLITWNHRIKARLRKIRRMERNLLWLGLDLIQLMFGPDTDSSGFCRRLLVVEIGVSLSVSLDSALDVDLVALRRDLDFLTLVLLSVELLSVSFVELDFLSLSLLSLELLSRSFLALDLLSLSFLSLDCVLERLLADFGVRSVRFVKCVLWSQLTQIIDKEIRSCVHTKFFCHLSPKPHSEQHCKHVLVVFLPRRLRLGVEAELVSERLPLSRVDIEVNSF